MSSANNQRGFSVLEVCIAAMLTIGLLAISFALVNRNQAIYTAETNTTDMNQNVRVAMDLLTRDLQTSGMGLSCTSGTMAAIYYVNGTSSAPDAIMILNGDPFAPWVDVDADPVGSAFTCTLTGDVTVTGSGGSATFSYMGPSGTMVPLFQNFSTASKYYVVYDSTRARVIRPNGNGSSPSAGKMTLGYSAMTSPVDQFSTAMGGATVLDNGA